MGYKSSHPFKVGDKLRVVSTTRKAKRMLGKIVTVRMCLKNRVVVGVSALMMTDFAYSEVEKI